MITEFIQKYAWGSWRKFSETFGHQIMVMTWQTETLMKKLANRRLFHAIRFYQTKVLNFSKPTLRLMKMATTNFCIWTFFLYCAQHAGLKFNKKVPTLIEPSKKVHLFQNLSIFCVLKIMLKMHKTLRKCRINNLC